MAKYPALTAEQIADLQWYASEHGRCWKQSLAANWYCGNMTLPALYALRNTHGPSWLRGFRFPKNA